MNQQEKDELDNFQNKFIQQCAYFNEWAWSTGGLQR